MKHIMPSMSYLFGIFILIVANGKSYASAACLHVAPPITKVCTNAIHTVNTVPKVERSLKNRSLGWNPSAEMHNKEDEGKPEGPLDEMLQKDIQTEGVIANVLGGLALFYNALANILLYPIFSFLLLALSLGAIVLVGFWIKKIKDEQPIATSWIFFTGVYVLLYLDLFLVVFQKRQVLFLFLELEKDLLLIITSVILGYTIGKFSSSKSFEEKELP